MSSIDSLIALQEEYIAKALEDFDYTFGQKTVSDRQAVLEQLQVRISSRIWDCKIEKAISARKGKAL